MTDDQMVGLVLVVVGVFIALVLWMTKTPPNGDD